MYVNFIAIRIRMQNRRRNLVRQELSLDELRKEIRKVTLEMLRLAGKRLSLAKKIGEIKRQRGLPMEDLDAEKELKHIVLEKCRVYGVDERFGLKLLNLLIDEAKRVQGESEGC